MRIEIVHATAGGTSSDAVEVPCGTTVAEAAAASRFADVDAVAFAVYGRLVRADRTLDPGDRVELLSDLLVDPKDARRMRAVHQGSGKETR